jgi:glycosyltransferase involved in cell wall biosynthesis
MRTIRALAAWGHDVTAIGFGAPPELPPGARFVALPEPRPGLRNRLGMAAGGIPARIAPALAPLGHWLRTHFRAARRAVLAARPEIVHANDWPALPAALAAKAAFGARLVYDSHEFAVEEYAHNRNWRLLVRPQVIAIETRGMAAADRVLTVSEGIAGALAARYPGCVAPVALRNVPDLVEQPFRPPADPPRLLYHGLIEPRRRVATMIAALAHLPAAQTLLIRGYGPAAHLAELRAEAAPFGARVRFEPAVPVEQVIPRANADADIGIFLVPDDTLQARFALPNKLFEYAMAGLAVLVTPGDDCAALVTRHGFGRVVRDDPAALAQAIRALPAEDVAAMKRAALEAARALNWAAESAVLRRVYEGL